MKQASGDEQDIMHKAGSAILKVTVDDFDFSKGPLFTPAYLGLNDQDIPDLRSYRMDSKLEHSIFRVILECCKQIIKDAEGETNGQI